MGGGTGSPPSKPPGGGRGKPHIAGRPGKRLTTLGDLIHLLPNTGPLGGVAFPIGAFVGALLLGAGLLFRRKR